MKRILITQQIQKIADDYLSEVKAKVKNGTILTLKTEIDEIERSRLPNWKLYKKYLEHIIKYYDSLIILHPEHFKCFWNRYFSFSKRLDLDSDSWKQNAPKFHKMIENAMNYTKIRDEIITPFIKKIGLKTCVYCNSTYILSTSRQISSVTDTDETEIKGRYQLDHFWAKSKFPFLSISFFNLQPSCSFCNLWKSKDYGKFNLYTDFYQKINPFRFCLDGKLLISYLLTMDSEKLNLELASCERGLAANHEKVFHLKEIYSQLSDEAEEIIWKSRIYDMSFLKQLGVLFKNKFSLSTNKDAFRFLYGFYPYLEDIHKRPLTKMKQDVAEQLGLV